jgi:hypothetical protein
MGAPGLAFETWVRISLHGHGKLPQVSSLKLFRAWAMLREQWVDTARYPGNLRSPGFLHGGNRLGMTLVDLLLIDKGDDPVFGLIAPYIPLAVAAARSGNPAARRQMPLGPLLADGHGATLSLPGVTL